MAKLAEVCSIVQRDLQIVVNSGEARDAGTFFTRFAFKFTEGVRRSRLARREFRSALGSSLWFAVCVSRVLCPVVRNFVIRRRYKFTAVFVHNMMANE